MFTCLLLLLDWKDLGWLKKMSDHCYLVSAFCWLSDDPLPHQTVSLQKASISVPNTQGQKTPAKVGLVASSLVPRSVQSANKFPVGKPEVYLKSAIAHPFPATTCE